MNLDRFKPRTIREERELERLQQEEDEMTQRDEYGTIIMDDEDAYQAELEHRLRAERLAGLAKDRVIRNQQYEIVALEDRVIELHNHLHGGINAAR